MSSTVDTAPAERGAATIEWGLVLLLIGILAIASVAFFGGQVGDLWDRAADASDGQISVVTTAPEGGGGGDFGVSPGGGGGDPIEVDPCDLEVLPDPEECPAP